MVEACTDRLVALLNHFPVRARTFHTGVLEAVTDFSSPGDGGQLHLMREGSLEVVQAGHPTLHVSRPSLLLYPRPLPRRFMVEAHQHAQLACANLHFEGGAMNPIAAALPDVVCLPLEDIQGADRSLSLLFDEAFSENCGRVALLDRLFEVVLIQVLRHLMETNQVGGGMLAGLSHPKLRKALAAMHQQPAIEWSLDALAEVAGMSRSVFANAFRDTVGCTPGVYLQRWRIRLAQQALHQGRQLKVVAIEVGYGSEAALSRAFRAHCGMTPREWRLEHAAK